MIQKIFLFIFSFLIFIFLLPFLCIFLLYSWFKTRKIRHIWKNFEKQTRSRAKNTLDQNVIDVEYEEIT